MKILNPSIIAICLSFSLSHSLLADEETTVTSGETLGEGTSEPKTIGTSTQTEGKLSQEFSGLLGSEEQAQTVVDGLRQGKAFTLGSETADTSSAQTPDLNTPELNTTELNNIVIEPPTGTMGYGNVKMTLSLAEAKLAEMGITQPTNEQLSAVLMGGEIEGQPVDGILMMRSEGMGWGEIAQQYDMKVGQLMGKSAHTAPIETTTTQTTTTRAPTSNSYGYVSPYSKKTPPGTVKHQANGYIPSSKQSSGKGIVSADGASVQQSGYVKNNGQVKTEKTVKIEHSNKHAYIPSGNPGSTSTAITSAAGSHTSNGKAKGHVNKK